MIVAFSYKDIDDIVCILFACFAVSFAMMFASFLMPPCRHISCILTNWLGLVHLNHQVMHLNILPFAEVAHDYEMGKPLGFSFTRLCSLALPKNKD